MAPREVYSRKQARRLAGIKESQLKSWEKQKLIESRLEYGFPDLVKLRAILKLRRNRRPASQIQRAVAAIAQKLRDVEDPLTELKIYADGRRIRVDVEGKAMEAESGQLLLDFSEAELSRLLEFPVKDKVAADRDRRMSAERWFQRGLDLERTGGPVEQVIEAYEKAIEFDSNSAGALVNLGTIYFNGRRWPEAERFYRRALEADPEYSLAHFDLANLYDECGDRGRAVEHYQAALRLSPNYADAHYNLALLYQGSNQPLKAVRHWTAYLKLDPGSQWAAIARRELSKLRTATVVQGGPS